MATSFHAGIGNNSVFDLITTGTTTLNMLPVDSLLLFATIYETLFIFASLFGPPFDNQKLK